MGQPSGMARLVAATLRDELRLYRGPRARNGAPTWSLHDPVRNQFFRIDWATFEVLSRHGLGDPARIAERIRAETTLDIAVSDVEAVLRFIDQHELTTRSGPGGAVDLARRARRGRSSPWVWLLHRYLFFRVPLWRPDRFLGAALPFVAPLYSRTFRRLTLLALCFGLVQVVQQWDRFMVTLVDLFSLRGLATYGVALIVVKFLHELGHAFTAKRLGCRVPTMGVAFLVMFPMAYTDVNEAWKLPTRRARLAVGSAGILTELTVAVWATALWGLLPEGPLKQVAFLLATTTWIATLAINASPFMRFDGYFLLMDAVDLPNLHERAGAMGRWRLREALFGLDHRPPETHSRPVRRALWAFAFATWTYRTLVFLGIAALVYWALPKPLGPLLAAAELGVFLVRPVIGEVRAWFKLRFDIARAPGRLRGLGLLMLLVLLLGVPWDTRVGTGALLQPTLRQPVVAPTDAKVLAVPAAHGKQVGVGEVLVVLQAPALRSELEAKKIRAAALTWRAEGAGVDSQLREGQAIIEAERARVRAEIAALELELSRNTVTAEAGGVLMLTEPDALAVGAWVAKNELLGKIVDPKTWQVVAYLDERTLDRVEVGDTARFVAESGARPAVALEVSRIDPDASRVLADPLLAASHGGEILVREQDDQLIPEQSLYRVVLTPLDAASMPTIVQILRGRLVIRGAPRAWATDTVRSILAALRRETGW